MDILNIIRISTLHVWYSTFYKIFLFLVFHCDFNPPERIKNAVGNVFCMYKSLMVSYFLFVLDLLLDEMLTLLFYPPMYCVLYIFSSLILKQIDIFVSKIRSHRKILDLSGCYLNLKSLTKLTLCNKYLEY